MLKHMVFKVVVALALLANASICLAEEDMFSKLDSFIAKTDAVASSDKPTKEKADIIDAEYVANFSIDVAKLSDDELSALFEATQYLLFYTLDKARLPLFEQLFERLTHAGKATPHHQKQLLQAYYALREFKKANAFIRRYSQNFPHRRPVLTEALSTPMARRTAWVFEKQGSLARRELNLDKGIHLIIIATPYCRFATAALHEIDNNPTLAPLLAGRVTVMAMNDFSFDYDTYAAWNQSHPSLPFTLAHSRDEWPEVSHWMSPVFMFFRDGKVVSSFSGWPSEGNMDKIYAGFGITVAADLAIKSQGSFKARK